MPEFEIRKTLTFVEEVHHENGPVADRPRQRGAVIAIVSTPFAGAYTRICSLRWKF